MGYHYVDEGLEDEEEDEDACQSNYVAHYCQSIPTFDKEMLCDDASLDHLQAEADQLSTIQEEDSSVSSSIV